MQYKTIIEIITDADNEYEAVDKAGEYLRGNLNSDIPIRVRTHSLNRGHYIVLGYAIAISFIVFALNFTWFSAGRTYQKIASNKNKIVETYAVQPPLSTDMNQKSGKNFKENWDKLYRERTLHAPDKNIDSK